MGRLTKVKSTKKTKEINLKTYDYLIHEKQFITKEKIQILNLPQKITVWCGAKEAGKTRPVVLRMIGLMEKDKENYGIGIKKFKINAAERLSQSMLNIVAELKNKEFAIPDYKKTPSKLERRFHNQRVNHLNQTVEFQSLDDINGLAGIEAPNLGRFELVHIEEPVEKNDSNIPTKKRFWEDIEVIERSINRSNVRNAQKNNTSTLAAKYHFTLNAWDDHPLVDEMEKKFPEDEFLNECLGVKDWKKLEIDTINKDWEKIKNNLINNHTAVRTEDEIAWVRLTRFANPNWNQSVDVYNKERAMSKESQLENFWDKLKLALLDKNYSYLAIHLGLKNQDQEDNKTYIFDNVEVTDTIKKIKKEKWRIRGFSLGWDIDMRRNFILTPVILGKNFLNDKIVHKLFLLPQKSFKARGDNQGRSIPLYKQKIKKFTLDTVNELTSLETHLNESLEFGKHIYIDDDYGIWLSEFSGLFEFFNVSKAKKHGKYSIVKRQQIFNILFNRSLIVIDKQNKILIDNFLKSIMKDGSIKRDESSTREKLYDRINSAEYAIYPFRNIIWW